jgi:hypothetical protein
LDLSMHSGKLRLILPHHLAVADLGCGGGSLLRALLIRFCGWLRSLIEIDSHGFLALNFPAIQVSARH